MKRKLILGLFCLLLLFVYRMFFSVDSPEAHQLETTETADEQVSKLLDVARTYIGTPHAYGKQSKKGIDCSGLVNISFKGIGLQIPRSSKNMASLGKAIEVDQLQPGDIVLFTHPGGVQITHSGIVTKFIDRDNIQFIHTSSSKGVIEESMTSKYWKQNFVMARRVL
ncbi:MAG: C40 family peptidase [Flammeovirgaceae bacterium]